MPPNKHMTPAPAAAVVAPGKGTEHEDEERRLRRVEERGDVSIRGMEAG